MHNDADRLLELLIALPLISTLIIFPLAMSVLAVASKRRTIMYRGFAVASDLLLSTIQLFVWLPTFQ